MSERPDGGPAFPSIDIVAIGDRKRGTTVGGATLRDYFAAEALKIPVDDARELPQAKCLNEALAMRAYAIADWMLLERAK